MPSAISPPKAVLGIDVGKSSHWACLVTREGEVAQQARPQLWKAISTACFPRSHAIRSSSSTNVATSACWRPRARLAGLGVAYSARARRAPGRHCCSRATPHRRARRPRHREDGAGHPRRAAASPRARPRPSRAARSLAAQRSHMVTCHQGQEPPPQHIAGIVPRVRGACRPGRPALAGYARKLGGPWGCIDAGKPAFGAVTKGANRARMDAAWNAAMASTRPSKRRVDAENPQVRMLARRIREALEEADGDRPGDRRASGRGTERTNASSPSPASGRGPRRSWS